MRLFSLDVFRGITIAAMILVNMAGVAGKVYPPLAHADWHGCTPTDLVFPFFLFIVGVAMSFSLSKYTAGVYRRIWRRTAILFLLGLLLNGFWNQGIWTFDLSNIRIMGVLQRISLTYLLAALAVLKLPAKGQWILAFVLLIGYWLIMMYVPVPDYGRGILTRTGNFGAYIDRLIIPPDHLYAGDGYDNLGDPEGLFSTIPAAVSLLGGYFAGRWIRNQPIKTRTSVGLGLFGLGCLIIGGVWGLTFPINKKLWTSSYVMFSTGWALLFLAGCYELIEVRLIRRWSKPFEIMGLNAIALFTASILLIKILVRTKIGTDETTISTYNWIYQNIFASWAGALNGSLLFALATLLFWLAVSYLMYRQQWFIKV
ncbi:heparan-alpha-glucosaminide N-acetyltransferase domain-containing protein [Anabaenopsis tanganyikae CS-531]|uniref:Heparan-alpha-glucosaminide N-acetyltransferase domain-containing protein n=2 Tax=Anabaenopsis TaxID=110103 RepID=A0ABT6KEL4_9CYAN|nr:MULTISPECIES: heparan-alpha-glucosaminide N-acetyltransferase domain-containing protein [Anabaenopsis]MDB9541526.1 heparan-alpha-glucosaminide N-acetyltransferase domain-containing protein [Anabaenopsis arnoldii]MDH6090505.1 heparan-alpha-glucosaminide N-acetyltransferase domain-containing protein [Anabaenopsis arnoldii]MDH6106320.1 heparan-alpha-glucosaminide N-acetyltransferase domain-containing protein [Anabaenopsis tanganyikae CS-531]